MRFPSRLLAANVWFALMTYSVFVAFVALVTAAIAIFGTITQSVWEIAAQAPRWYALFVGIALVREFLPLYIAHGQTRRQFGAQAAVTVAILAPVFSILLVVGYLLEWVVYGVAGWPQALSQAHLFSAPTQVHLVVIEYLVELFAWIVAGTFIGAGFYRWEGGGFLAIPVGIGLVVLAKGAVGTELHLPFLAEILELNLPRSPAIVLGVGLGTFLLGLALTWSVIRDVPLRNKMA